MKYCSIIIILFLSGCTSTGVIPTENNAYKLTRTGLHSGFGTPDVVKNGVYDEANDFCSKTNSKVETIKLEITKSEYVGPVKMFLQFKCI